MSLKIEVTYNGTKCFVEIGTYFDRHKRIQLYDADDGMPFATASINVPDQVDNFDEVVIKDYHENEGIYQTLLDANVILPSHREVITSGLSNPVCFIAPQLV